MAARTVCGSQPSRCPISATDAPSGRSSMPISIARFVLARGPSALGTLVVPTSALPDGGLDCEACGSGDEVVFFDRSMPSEAPSGATAASPAAELVWLAADFARPCELRLRGWRSDLRAGSFVLAVLVARLWVCLLAIVCVLWIRTAPVAMLAPPQARRSGAARAAARRCRRHGP